jgi:hypothetical protein
MDCSVKPLLIHFVYGYGCSQNGFRLAAFLNGSPSFDKNRLPLTFTPYLNPGEFKNVQLCRRSSDNLELDLQPDLQGYHPFRYQSMISYQHSN